LRLHGILHMPAAPYPSLVVGSHGLYSTGASPKQCALAADCCRMGLAYFRFDHRGCGRSEGRFEAVTSLAGRRNDLIDAVACLRERYPLGTGLGLFGSSMGGATCLAAAFALKPERLVTLAAPVDSRSILTAAARHEAPVAPLFYGDTFQFDLRDDIGRIGNILVIHGMDDEVIPVRHADVIFQHSREPKKQLLLEGGDHRLSRPEHQQHFMAAAREWFKPLTGAVPTAK
jgi:alpha-beta hydrolase superfamily lysophospholipase